MLYDELGKYVELRQGLAINKKSNHLVSNKKNEQFIYPLLRIADMMDNHYEKYISSDVNPNVVAHEDDIIYTRTGQIGLVFRNMLGVVHNNSFIVSIKNELLDKNYLYVLLQSDFVKSQALKLANNSVQSDLTHEMFKSIIVPIPSLSVQRKIAKIILDIDNKIEINNELCNNYILYVKEIYNRWFLQFEFPLSSGNSYKSSGGIFKYSSELDIDIPEDWSVKKLSELLIKNNEKYDGKDDIKTIDLSVMPSNNIVLPSYNSSLNFSTNLFKMNRGDLLFGSIRPYLLKGGIAPFNGVVAGTVYSYKPVVCSDYNYLALSLFCDRTFKHAVKVSKGTKMPVVGSDDLLELQLPYNKEVAEQFNKLNLLNIISHIVEENNELISYKDYLLPKLLSGKILTN